MENTQHSQQIKNFIDSSEKEPNSVEDKLVTNNENAVPALCNGLESQATLDNLNEGSDIPSVGTGDDQEAPPNSLGDELPSPSSPSSLMSPLSPTSPTSPMEENGRSGWGEGVTMEQDTDLKSEASSGSYWNRFFSSVNYNCFNKRLIFINHIHLKDLCSLRK